MGTEGDRLVYDYLSRVGDLAQQNHLPAGERMRLVAELRSRIDSRRTGGGTDSPAAVRRILGRIGTPDEVVARAGTGTPPGTPSGSPPGPPGGPPAWPSVPEQRGPRPAGAAVPERAPGGAHDWWRVEEGAFGDDGRVPGFTGGIEIPELRRRWQPDLREEDADEADGKTDGKAREADRAPAPGGRRRFLRPAARPEPVPGPAAPAGTRPGLSNPFLLLAAALLVAGAVLGSLVPLAVGWGLAYLSRRLTPAEAKTAVLGIPAVVAVAAAVWLWGRTEGRWGPPVPREGLADALSGTWPWALRIAAVASALFLVQRSRRSAGVRGR